MFADATLVCEGVWIWIVPRLQLIGPLLDDPLLVVLDAELVFAPVDDMDEVVFDGVADAPEELLAAVAVWPLGKHVTLTLWLLLLELEAPEDICRVPRLHTTVPAGRPLAAELDAVEVCPLEDEVEFLNGTPVACVSRLGFAANCSNVVPLLSDEDCWFADGCCAICA